MSRYKPYFVTSARLAELLAMSGIELTPCQNIYNPDRRAWKCPITPETAKIICEFYDEIGKTAPDCVMSALSAPGV